MKHLAFVIFLIFALAACSPPKPPCCEDIGGIELHPINPEMMPIEQIRALQVLER